MNCPIFRTGLRTTHVVFGSDQVPARVACLSQAGHVLVLCTQRNKT